MSEIPPIEKQSEIIAQIDKLITLCKERVTTLEKLRMMLLVQWFVKGDKKEYMNIMLAELYGESFVKHPLSRARSYFKTYIETWRARNKPQREPCAACKGTGFVHGSCCRTCEGSMSIVRSEACSKDS